MLYCSFQVIFTCHVPGEVTDVYLPCRIEDMEQYVVLGFYANVQELSVNFSTPKFTGLVRQ